MSYTRQDINQENPLPEPTVTTDAAETPKWNPRYLAYCAAEKVATPDEMLAIDQQRWPGGSMCGFMLWLRARYQEWYQVIGGQPAILFPEHYRAFDQWLNASVGLPVAA